MTNPSTQRYSTLRYWIQGVACVVALSLCCTLSADEPVEATITTSPEKHVVSWFLIGGSSATPEDRYVGWDLRQSGWGKFVFMRVRPGLEGGIRRVLLHNPFGHELPNNTMAFDGSLNADEQGHDWLVEGFVEAWKPVVEGRWSGGDPVEVICYLGRLDEAPGFEALKDASDEEGYQARAWASVALPLAAGMSIAVDSSADLPENHPGFRFIRDLRDSGVRVYVEARPDTNKPHLHNWPMISVESFWERSDPTRHADARGMERDAHSHGEVIQLFTERKLTPAIAQEKLAQGYSVAAQLNHEIWQANKLNRWLNPQ
ncbi:hypothetical protein [Algisphaera agarilytica]|uniref:Uncharacterized protein n=1 Tax=Algisphaera agarilytica TaxID=1385975 RepID=A0A7X0H7M6_9BACT|nr:hypothetical protein [Algisphaera agarilytica]MBB6430790.1 hypothetical protein [Algisphaera agarilytica]